MIATPLLLVGGGKMGRALLEGWLAQGVAADAIFIVEPEERARAELNGRGCRAFADPRELAESFAPAAIVLAVKPQIMDSVLPDYRRFRSLFLSIAAGRTVASIAQHLGEAAIVRSMPNLPASIGAGMSALYAPPNVSPAARDQADALLRAVGATEWIEDEALMDAVTALSGSGPAYVFLLVEALEAAAVKIGLPAASARRLARQTVVGAGALLSRSGEEAAQLRRAVTSPGGTTEAALAVLMGGQGWQASLDAALRAAAERSRALSR